VSLLHRTANLFSPLRRLVEERDSLLAECSDLRARLAQKVLQDDASSLSTAEADVFRSARAEGRMILTDYSYHPQTRPLEISASGRCLVRQFRLHESRFRQTLLAIAAHSEALARIPRDSDSGLEPFWDNGWFPPFDGVSLYGLIAERKPQRYVEVGSGISTRFARRAVQDLGLTTRIVSIDPHPRTAVEGLCDETIVSRMEDLPGGFWESFAPSDMLFIDNSHRSFPGSDVTVFFSEVLPALPLGTLYGIHDIFLPQDYPEDWRGRFYNEQYLLLMYLLGGADGDEVVLPVKWAGAEPQLHGLLAGLWQKPGLFDGLYTQGGSFWLRRRIVGVQ
jgi:predicted O-methyltransferase YrrM